MQFFPSKNGTSEKTPLFVQAKNPNTRPVFKPYFLLWFFIAFVCVFGLALLRVQIVSGPVTYVLASAEIKPNNTTIWDLEIQVKIETGKLQGKRLTSRAGRNYLAFLGVPYGRPPVGTLRFQPPLPAESWKGTRDATAFQNVCIEKERVGNAKLADQPDVTIGSEDCLYLNVFTPKEASELRQKKNLFPVMLYIHGGNGGAFGSGQKYGADYFMDEDVVLITLEYRLGVLGNLNTKTRLASGNQGLKDQLLALQWIQNNVQAFGGDKNKVTIFGNSFGGIQVTTHMVSPLGKGLYHRAIAQSGSTLYPGFFTKDPLHDARRLGELLNCPTAQAEELTVCLMNASASDLVIQGLKFKNKYNYVFTISEDIASDPGNVFLPLGPLESLQAGAIKNIPFITGIVNAEGLKDSLEVMTDPPTLAAFQENWTQMIVPTLYLQYTTQDPIRLDEMAKKIQNFYLGKNGNENPLLRKSNLRNFTKVFTDRLYSHPAATITQFLRQKYRMESSPFKRGSKQNIYFYQFSHEVEKSRADPVQAKFDGNAEYFGVCHADELQFFFPMEDFPYICMKHPYRKFSQLVVKLWVDFARNGVPTGAITSPTWVPVNDEHPYRFLNLNEKPGMMEKELESRIEFWNQFNLTELYM